MVYSFILLIYKSKSQVAKISQFRIKNITSNDSNAIHIHAKSHYSTVMFHFHVHTEIPDNVYCLGKLRSWQERVLKEGNICFDSCRINAASGWCFSKQIALPIFHPVLFDFTGLSACCTCNAVVPGARGKPGADQALWFQAFHFIPWFFSCKKRLMALPAVTKMLWGKISVMFLRCFDDKDWGKDLSRWLPIPRCSFSVFQTCSF